MKKVNELPKVFGEHNRPANKMNVETLKVTGQAFVTYGIQTDEVIEFPDTIDDIQAVEQKINQNRDAMQRLLVVKRYNKAHPEGRISYLSLGVLNRTDFNREPTCDFTAEMGKLDNDYDRVIALLGKKITCKETKMCRFQKFDRQTGQRLEGESEDRPTPVITYA